MTSNKLTKSQRLLIIIAISLSFFLAEIAVGFYTRALVLVADAFHYLNDLIGYVVAFVAFKVSERSDAPKALPFGWQRATLLGAFFNGVFLLALGVSIFLQSIERFVSLEHVQKPELVLIVGCVGLVLNILSASVLHEHSHDNGSSLSPTELRDRVLGESIHAAHRHERESGRNVKSSGHGQDLGVLGVLLHVAGDALNNVGVIIAAAVIWKTSYAARFYADPAVSLGIAATIMLSSFPLMRRSGSILMQTTPEGVDPDDVKHDLETIPAVASAHVVISNKNMHTIHDFMTLANTINGCFHAYGIHSATLQPEITPLSAFPDSVTAHVDTSEEGLQRRVGGYSVCNIGCRVTACEESTCCD